MDCCCLNSSGVDAACDSVTVMFSDMCVYDLGFPNQAGSRYYRSVIVCFAVEVRLVRVMLGVRVRFRPIASELALMHVFLTGSVVAWHRNTCDRVACRQKRGYS